MAWHPFSDENCATRDHERVGGTTGRRDRTTFPASQSDDPQGNSVSPPPQSVSNSDADEMDHDSCFNNFARGEGRHGGNNLLMSDIRVEICVHCLLEALHEYLASM